MKKIARNVSILLIALLFACCLVVGLAACDDGESTSGESPDGESLPGVIFEAEYTDVTSQTYGDRLFMGPDTESIGAILKADDASNGYCIGNMGVKDCYIFYEITSDTAATAELYMSASMDYEMKGSGSTVTLTDKEFEVLVNTQEDSGRIQYGSFDYKLNGLKEDYTHKAFVEYSLGTVNLQVGTNIIIFKTNNATHSNVQNITATAPIIDYLRIVTDAELSWTPIESNLTGSQIGGETTLV